jgi:hypothetical protein
MTTNYLNPDNFNNVHALRASYDILKAELAEKTPTGFLTDAFDIYDHYASKQYEMTVDPTDEISWKAVFLYHQRFGWRSESDAWPVIRAHLQTIPSIISAQINFIAPGGTVPYHRDSPNPTATTTMFLVIQAGENEFTLNTDVSTLVEGQIIAFDGVANSHKLKNLSSSTWLVMLTVDTDL